MSRGELFARILFLFLLLFGFLVAIETMSKAIKALADTGMLGGDKDELFAGVSNPFAGLALGVLFTVLVQSSSTTTATIVAVVGSGALSVEHAVPMILGANIGTTITNTLVSIGHVRRSNEFQRAFAAATVHDFFNLMVVAVMLPLELTTHFLSRTAYWLTDLLAGGGGGGGGGEYKSPIKSAIKSVHGWIVDSVESTGLDGKLVGIVCLVIGIGITFLCLYQITVNMRRVIAPMCAAGVLSLDKAFPVMLGANIGTTVTALLASMAQDRPEALTIALVHVLFNTIGVAVVYPFQVLRNIPLNLARGLAVRCSRAPIWVGIYVIGTFVILPLSGWLLWRNASW